VIVVYVGMPITRGNRVWKSGGDGFNAVGQVVSR
jgi:hypothetical protein